MSGKVVVFGGSGFIGTHLVRRLSTEGISVVSVDRREPRQVFDGVDYLRADVRDLRDLQMEGEIDRIYNFAAVHTTPGHPNHEYYDTNVLGADQITAFARRHNVDKIIFTSSISVYGPGEDAKSENTPVAPVSAYGWSKWLAEEIHRSWLAESTKRSLVICRPAVVFGAGEGGNFTRMASLLSRGFFVFPGRRDTIKACIYVGDLIDFIRFAEGVSSMYSLFNGCYADNYTIEQIVETLRCNHFPSARTFTVPRSVVMGGAMILWPLSKAGIGVHPDRVLKLVKSTNVIPGWLLSHNQALRGALPKALSEWSNETAGTFK